MSRHVLLLNASYEPLTVVSDKRAISLILKDKVDTIIHNGTVYRSETRTIKGPSVIKLRTFVRVPKRRILLTKRSVFIRDNWECQYCGKPANEIDHVVPKSRGGTHEWSNVVAACKACNARKGDRVPPEAGLVLRRPPRAPTEYIWVAMRGSVPAEWRPFLLKKQ